MEYFHHLPEWTVVVCKECQYAVWPDQVKGHLQGKQHRVPIVEASGISEKVQEWPGVTRFPSEFQMPTYVEEPVVEIPLYTDGWKCRLDDQQCPYICRDIKTIKKHWRTHHGWSVRSARGGSGREKAQAVKKRFREGAKPVYCQRVFPQGVHSQYFEVRQPEDATTAQIHASTSEAAWSRAWQRANEYWELMQEEAHSKIQQGETTEVTPWLKRTGWLKYLDECDRKELLESIRQPNVNEDDEDEPIEGAVWQAMGDIAAISQTTVENSGVMLRLEAIRTEMHQTRYQPLQPYQDAKTVHDQCKPWQQMLMFFVRTQREHGWKSPPYRFNQRQFAAYEKFIATADATTVSDDESEGGEESEVGSDVGSEPSTDQSPSEAAGRPTPEPKPLTRIQRACLEFCIELLNQRIHNNEYDMALICATAVLGVRPFGGGYRDPESYPPVLSAIVKIAHFMVVQQAEQQARSAESNPLFSPCSSPCNFEDSGYESNSGESDDSSRPRHRNKRRSHHRSSFEWVRKMMDSFMVRGSGSPIQWILDLRTYGLKVHYNTTAVGHVNWKDKYTLEYKAIRFNVAQFREMVHQLVESTRRTLFEDVLFAQSRKDVPNIPWDMLFDDPTNGEVGWNFINDQRSRLPVDGRDGLSERIRSQSQWRDPFVRKDAAGGIDRERMRDWMRKVAQFRGLLLILMHISGGQPARGTEILSVRHRNTTAGGRRNMFIEDGGVVFVTRYHKGFQMSGDVKIIHRYLPREVGELVVWYLWLALPFIQRMEAMLWEKATISDHMWPADADGKKWTTDRMKGELQKVSKAGLGYAVTVAAYREIAVAISRQWVRGATAFQSDQDEENEEWEKENTTGNAADEQATHSPHIAGLIYARNSMEMAGTTADRRRQFRAVSTDWHRFLGFESSRIKDEKTDLKRKRCPFEDDADDERLERRIRLQRMNANAGLQQMMQKEVSLRSVQAEAMEAVQRGDSPIVAVMPTGAGKSMLFMLPAWVEPGGVTIVVVPLKALRKDMVHRCEKLGIRCAVWTGRDQPDSASIVLVTPEKAASEEFGTFMSRIRQTRRLDRIVIDECHVILNNQLDFRKNLQELGKLAFAETQMVLLTATLPPADEEDLFERMYWKREEVRLIRGSTVRTNIQYSVIDGCRTRREKDAQLEEIVEEVLKDTTEPEGKAVVMCESKDTVRDIVEAGLFPCEMFHADLPDEVKEETLDEFRAGNIRVIVATGAFGMGIDIPDIRLMVHVDNPRNMRDYGQASGRAGRDGLPSRAIVIRGGIDFEDELVSRYVDPERKKCRRIEIDGYLDGSTTRERCEDGEYPCDCCEDGGTTNQAAETIPETQAPDRPAAQGPVRPATQGPVRPATQGPVRPATQGPVRPATQGPVRPATQVSFGPAAQGPVRPATQAPVTRRATQAPAGISSNVQRAAETRREIQVQDQHRRAPEVRRTVQVRTGAAPG